MLLPPPVEIATEVIDKFDRQYEEKWFVMMKSKLGLIGKNKALACEVIATVKYAKT